MDASDAGITRMAVIARRNGRPAPETVAAYLPRNYGIASADPDEIIISGQDNAGWTLDAYVIPRLASGLIYARERPVHNWQPAYASWRHGGWYVTNIHYPSGAIGCVSRNYPDGKWRIVCDPRPGAHEEHTFRTRDDAARAERELARDRWARVAELAARLAPVTGAGTGPNERDAPCAACGTVVRAEKGLEIPGLGTPPAVLDGSCSGAVAREQDDPGGARLAPDGYARPARPARRAAASPRRTESSQAHPSRRGNGH